MTFTHAEPRIVVEDARGCVAHYHHEAPGTQAATGRVYDTQMESMHSPFLKQLPYRLRDEFAVDVLEQLGGHLAALTAEVTVVHRTHVLLLQAALLVLLACHRFPPSRIPSPGDDVPRLPFDHRPLERAFHALQLLRRRQGWTGSGDLLQWHAGVFALLRHVCVDVIVGGGRVGDWGWRGGHVIRLEGLGILRG